MYISNKLIFVELQKTASSHIKKILLELFDGESVGKHNIVPHELLANGSTVIGSIRNPWDWYVSLWAFGCGGRGSVFRRVTRKNPKVYRGLGWRTTPHKAALRLIEGLISDRHAMWQLSYANADDPAAFRQWLKLMTTPKYFPDIDESYSNWPGNRDAGLLTFRYLKLFCSTTSTYKELNKLHDNSQIQAFESANFFVDHILRQESLDSDLRELIVNLDQSLISSYEKLIQAKPKSNESSRRLDLNYYYDDEAIALVANREKLIIDKFEYKAP